MIQVIAVMILAAGFLFVQGSRYALATLCGGLVYLTPSYFYAQRLFSNISVHAVTRLMRTFYLGEALKIFLSVGLFIALFYWANFPLMPYFLGYAVVALAFCIAPWVVIHRTTRFS